MNNREPNKSTLERRSRATGSNRKNMCRNTTAMAHPSGLLSTGVAAAAASDELHRSGHCKCWTQFQRRSGCRVPAGRAGVSPSGAAHSAHPPASIQALPNDVLDVARTPSRSSPATSQTLPNIWRKSVTYVVPTPIPQWSA